MKTSTLLIELLIVGLLATVSLILIFSLLHQINYELILDLFNKGGSMVLILLIIIYTLGVISHRSVEILFRHVFYRKQNKDEKKELEILQYGSQYVNNRFLYEQSLLRIFSSISIFMPIIGFLYCINPSFKFGVFVLVSAIVLMILGYVCYRAQKKSIHNLCEEFKNYKQ